MKAPFHLQTSYTQ